MWRSSERLRLFHFTDACGSGRCSTKRWHPRKCDEQKTDVDPTASSSGSRPGPTNAQLYFADLLASVHGRGSSRSLAVTISTVTRRKRPRQMTTTKEAELTALNAKL